MDPTDQSAGYRRAIEFLYELRWFGTKFGLENVRDLARLAGNPHERLRFVHVAGTNGKGSTCAMLESVYRAAGWRVGLFTSPHLVSFRERIQVNRQWIPEADAVRIVNELKELLGQMADASRPTFFEVVTVMALRYFEEQKCDLVIWETGLGGRLDATNIVQPAASVITNIQFDHEKWLGNTLAQIAFEKAGIIKPNTPVITGVENAEAFSVIERIANEHNAPLIRTDIEALEHLVPGVRVSLRGQHQLRNAAVAVATAKAIELEFPVSEHAIRAGLENVDWPGRLQVLTRRDGKRIVLDGAHNVSGAEALAAGVRSMFGSEPVTLILGVLADKNHGGMCQALARLAERILLVPVQSERSAALNLLAEECRDANPSASIACCDSLEQALECAPEGEVVLITGSLYLVGEALELLAPAKGQSERALNEWGAVPHLERRA